MKKQTEINENRKKQRAKLFEWMPEATQHSAALGEAAYKDGVLDAKTKRLLALAIALGVGCTNCELSQTERALALGATKEEILEVIGVVLSMRGTTGMAESLRVIEYLDEREDDLK